MVVGTIPGAILGFLFQRRIEDQFRLPLVIGIAMIVVGLLMWWADTRSSLSRRVEQSNLGDAIAIGTAQALALVPGVSRSGITITTGLFRGLTRDAATRFSFILSTPVIAGAVLLELPKLIRLHRVGGLDLPLATLMISILVSGIVGVAVIAFFLRYLQTRTLKFFVVYRLLFGIVILLLAFLHWGSAR
jgi:undecaprenyl-diphosphatase